MKVSAAIKKTIAQADTAEKVWDLLDSMVNDLNGYSPEMLLENIARYTDAARAMYIANK